MNFFAGRVRFGGLLVVLDRVLRATTKKGQLFEEKRARPDKILATPMTRLSSCANDIISWYMYRRLHLNASKTEAIWIGSRCGLAKLSSRDCSIQIGTSTIQPSTVVHDHGVHLYSELSIKQHIAKVAVSCLNHLGRLGEIRRRVGSVFSH